MATASTSARFTRSSWLSKATGTPKSFLAASADSRRLVDSAVISKSSESDFKAGMCACAAHPRSGLAPMMPTRILLSPFLLVVVIPCPCKLDHRGSSLVGLSSSGLLSFRLRRECDYRYDPLGLLLVLGELWVERGLFLVESVAFGARNLLGVYVDRLGSDLDLHVGVSLEVVVPVGMCVCSSLRGEDQVAVAVLEIHYRVDPDLAGARAGVIDE